MPYPISYYGLAVDFIYCKGMGNTIVFVNRLKRLSQVLVYALMETLNSRYAIRGPAVDRSTDDTSLELTTRSISPTQVSLAQRPLQQLRWTLTIIKAFCLGWLNSRHLMVPKLLGHA